MSPITEEQRKKIYNDLADILLNAMSAGQISEDESKETSLYILDKLDKVQTKDELNNFLEGLSKQWPIYKTAYTKAIGEETEKEDEKKISEIQNKLNQLIINPQT